MAYQQTNATNVSDLVNKITLFASANGWTIHRNNEASGLRTVTLQKTGDYIHMWMPSTSGFNLRASVGYDGALAATAQPLQSVSNSSNNTGTGPFSNVFLFANEDCIFWVVEIASGIFRHGGFGMLQKIGSYTGGTFFDQNNIHPTYDPNEVFYHYHHRMFDNQGVNNGSRGAVRCDLDGNSNYFAPFSSANAYSTPVASGALGGYEDSAQGEHAGRATSFFGRSINSWSGVTPLQPVKIRVERPSGYWSEIGIVPGIRYLNMTRFQAADEFSIGPDTWKVMPWVRKGYVYNVTQPYSGEHAFAFLKTV